MKSYPIEKIRNICLLGHGGTGKTTLTEAMLNLAGASDRLGKVADGTTVTDFDPEEIRRQISINVGLCNLEWKGGKVNIIDTPGYFDFEGEILEGVRVADAAVIVVSGKPGVSVGTENVWKYCSEKKIAKVIFINRLDDENSNFATVLNETREKFGNSVPLRGYEPRFIQIGL